MHIADPRLAGFFVEGKAPPYIPSELRRRTLNKLAILEAAESLEILFSVPGNRLEKLQGKYKGYYSIRPNQQYRLIFQWINREATNVQFIDYH